MNETVDGKISSGKQMKARPPQIIVVSVPHSATRTLRDWLRLSRHYHFGNVDQAVREHYAGHDSLVNIPIRNPMDVARSWAIRRKGIDQLVSRYNAMFQYLAQHNPTIWQVESLPKLAGLDDKNREKGKPEDIPEYQDAVMSRVVLPHGEFFYERYGELRENTA